MVTSLHAPMNAFAFGQYTTETHQPCVSKCDWTIAGRFVVDAPEIIT